MSWSTKEQFERRYKECVNALDIVECFFEEYDEFFGLPPSDKLELDTISDSEEAFSTLHAYLWEMGEN